MRSKKELPFDKSKYDRQYMRDHVKRVVLSLNAQHDKDIIEHLEKVDNKSGYIKRLIRKDISDPDRD